MQEETIEQNAPLTTEQRCQTAVQLFDIEIKRKFTKEKVNFLEKHFNRETGNKASPSCDGRRGTDGPSVNLLLGLRHRNRWALRVIESIHCGYTHDHVEAVHEDQQENQCRQQPHPDPWREEACAVASVGEIFRVAQAKALNLERKTNHDGREKRRFFLSI